MSGLEGICPIVPTPFTASGEVDDDSLYRVVDTLCADGASGLTLFGVASELNKLTDEERRTILETVAGEVRDRPVALIVNVTHDSAEIAAKQARRAEEAGADCLMVLPPTFLDPDVDDHYRHIKRVATAVEVPILIQYRPQTTGVGDVSFYARLNEEIDNLDYFKVECVPPGATITELLEHPELDVDVFEGFAGIHMIEALDRGATGVLPGSSMCSVYAEIYDRYTAGDREGALALHDELVPMLSHLRQSAPMLIHYEKRILRDRGVIDSAYCRLPRFDPDEHYDRLFEHYYETIRDRL